MKRLFLFILITAGLIGGSALANANIVVDDANYCSMKYEEFSTPWLICMFGGE